MNTSRYHRETFALQGSLATASMVYRNGTKFGAITIRLVLSLRP